MNVKKKMWGRLAIICVVAATAWWLSEISAGAQPAPGAPPAGAQPAPATAPPGTAATSSDGQPGGTAAGVEPVIPASPGGYVYLPEGRRDPFQSILKEAKGPEGAKGTDEINLPPLQRVTVAELTVIGIVWGGFGYTAMLQTPDGRGYAVQRGARVGSNGVVSAITEKAVFVEERITDIYGKKQVREYSKPLHGKESQP